MNVVFLDYDGVVNTPMWDAAGKHCRYNFPEDDRVNNFQCVQWVSEFCERYGYDIVVSSTWRMDDNYVDCLKNGGLRDSVRVVGATPVHRHDNASRGGEILAWLLEHQEVGSFLIFDDEDDFAYTPELREHLILCDPTIGFGLTEFYKAKRLHESLENKALAGADDTLRPAPRKAYEPEERYSAGDLLKFRRRMDHIRAIQYGEYILGSKTGERVVYLDDRNITEEEAVKVLRSGLYDPRVVCVDRAQAELVFGYRWQEEALS